VKSKMDTSTSLKKRTNIQASRFRLRMVRDDTRVEIIRRLKLQQGTAATHMLKNQGEASSAG
jgi:hypothetical protein